MIRATAMVQIVGKPKEHIEKVLDEVSSKVEEHGYKTERLEVMPVEILDEDEGFYSGLFEVDLALKNHEQLFGFIQDFNPLSMEVTDPDEFEMTLPEYNALVSTVAGTVQQYDGIIKEKLGENAALVKRNDALTKNILVLCLASGPKAAGRIKRETGLGEETIKTYLAALIKTGMVAREGELFRLVTDKNPQASE